MDSFLKSVFVRAGKTHVRSRRAPTHNRYMFESHWSDVLCTVFFCSKYTFTEYRLYMYMYIVISLASTVSSPNWFSKLQMLAFHIHIHDNQYCQSLVRQAESYRRLNMDVSKGPGYWP